MPKSTSTRPKRSASARPSTTPALSPGPSRGKSTRVPSNIVRNTHLAPQVQRLQDHVQSRLEDFLTTINDALNTFDAVSELGFAQTSWYHDLRVRRSALLDLRGVAFDVSFFMADAINLPFEVNAVVDSFPDDIALVPKEHFILLEASRILLLKAIHKTFPENIASNFRKPISGSSRITLPFVPSKIAKDKETFQRLEGQAFRLGRPFANNPIILESQNHAFYLYSDLWKLLRRLDPEEDLDDDYSKCRIAVFKNIPSLSELLSHDSRARRLLDLLKEVFPDTSEFKWFVNHRVFDGVKAAIDLVYRRVADGYAIIFVEVKREPGEGGDPIFQANAYYALTFLDDSVQAQREKSGAPAILMAFAGMYLQLYAAVCDTKRGSHASLPLPGHIDFSFSCGLHQQEAIRTLWCLRKSVTSLIKTLVPLDSTGHLRPEPGAIYYAPHESIPNIPQVGLKSTGIRIIGEVKMGSLYLGELVAGGISEDHPQLQNILHHSVNGQVHVLLTYPHRGEKYQTDLQTLLAETNYATPVYSFAPTMTPFYPQAMIKALEKLSPKPNSNPIFSYHIMPVLPPPTPNTPGWISLHQLAEYLRQGRSHRHNKEDIQVELQTIIAQLKESDQKYSSFTAKHVLVKVNMVTPGEGYELIPQDNSNGINLKLTMFQSTSEPKSLLTMKALRSGWWQRWPN